MKRESILPSLIMLTMMFMLVELSFFIQSNSAYLSDFTFVSHQLSLPKSILPGIGLFIFAQLLVHAVYCLLVWRVAVLVSPTLKFAMMLWCVGLLTILVANQYYFPNSKFAELTGLILFSPLLLNAVFIILLAILGMIAAIAIFRMRVYLSLGLVGLLAVLYFYPRNAATVTSPASKTMPNIIIIGMDSFRPDYISAPFIDSWLNQATVFYEAVTPLARTFPSWMSILTGRYPKNINIRFNLAKPEQIQAASSLPMVLKQRGYHTVFATDETRFSNIDQRFGFDAVITPPIGLNDFLLGTFNDFPLSNLLVNTIVGKWLFPHSYANRPVYFTYDPDSFIQLLKPELSAQQSKPVFLAVHFCLTHYPYMYSNLNIKDMPIRERYAASVKRLDQQINQFYALLEQYHWLDNAIVVLLSDHGEALELPGDRLTEASLFQGDQQKVPAFYPPSLDKEEVNQSAGHGTDVLGLTQYHVLLGFKLYGRAQTVAVVPGVVSLLDIEPTILALLVMPSLALDGKSLAATILDHHPVPAHDDIFMESDYSPAAIRTVYPETRKVMLEGIELFEINPATARLEVKDKMGQMIIHSKQYADLKGEWILAIYPQANGQAMPILVNLKTGKWTNNLQSDLASHSPASQMLTNLQLFYQKDLPKLSNG